MDNESEQNNINDNIENNLKEKKNTLPKNINLEEPYKRVHTSKEININNHQVNSLNKPDQNEKEKKQKLKGPGFLFDFIDSSPVVIEYGKTKKLKRPNIKKGKDFTHNFVFKLKGIIEGRNSKNKRIPTNVNIIDGDKKDDKNLLKETNSKKEIELNLPKDEESKKSNNANIPEDINLKNKSKENSIVNDINNKNWKYQINVKHETKNNRYINKNVDNEFNNLNKHENNYITDKNNNSQNNSFIKDKKSNINLTSSQKKDEEKSLKSQPKSNEIGNQNKNLERKNTVSLLIQYGRSNIFERPKIKKGKDFEHKPIFFMNGIIEGKLSKNKQNIDNNINILRKIQKIRILFKKNISF